MNVAFILTKMANIESIISCGGVKKADKVNSCFNLALNILQNSGDKDYVKRLKTMHKASAGEIMFLRGMEDIALQYYNECVDDVEYLVDKEFAILSHCLGLVYKKQGDHFSLNELNNESSGKYDKAIAQFEKASEVFEMVWS